LNYIKFINNSGSRRVITELMPLANYIDRLHERELKYTYIVAQVTYTEEEQIYSRNTIVLYFEKDKHDIFQQIEPYTCYSSEEFLEKDEIFKETFTQIIKDVLKKQPIIHESVVDKFSLNVDIQYITTFSKDMLYYYILYDERYIAKFLDYCFNWLHQILYLGLYPIEQYLKDILSYKLFKSLDMYLSNVYRIPHPFLADQSIRFSGDTDRFLENITDVDNEYYQQILMIVNDGYTTNRIFAYIKIITSGLQTFQKSI